MSPIEPAPDSLLRHRPFVLYWSARVSGLIAFQMVGVAVGWQMYALTGSALDLGLVGLVQFLPATATVLIAGQLADRYHRLAMVQVFQLIQALATAALALGSLQGWITKEYMLIAVFCLGVGRSGDITVNQTLLPAVVPPVLFSRAVAAWASAHQAATIGGPALGGFLYVLGPDVVYGICFVLLLIAILQLAFVPYESNRSRTPVSVAGFFAGIGYIWRNRIVLGVMTLDLFAVLLGSAVSLLPIFAKDILEVGPQGLGLLRAAPAVGALLMLIVLTRWTVTRAVGRIEFAAVAMFGVATLVFGLSTSFWLSLMALAALGAADAVSVVIRMTLVQIETPDVMRGRVSAVNSLFVSMSNQIGDFRAGLVASWIGAVPAVLIGGGGTILSVLVFMRLFPALYRMEKFRSAPPPD